MNAYLCQKNTKIKNIYINHITFYFLRKYLFSIIASGPKMILETERRINWMEGMEKDRKL